jgi:hypothetical protein
MQFGLINVGETFQREMDIAFRGLNGDCVLVHLYDVTIFSKDKKDHINHLRRVFNRCTRYGISFNPKKYVFVVDKGILLGFIISKHGIEIEPKRTKAISKIPPPHKKIYVVLPREDKFCKKIFP